jgi:hypothetical protein
MHTREVLAGMCGARGSVLHDTRFSNSFQRFCLTANRFDPNLDEDFMVTRVYPTVLTTKRLSASVGFLKLLEKEEVLAGLALPVLTKLSFH